MAGTKNGDFRELLSPFLKEKIEQASKQYGRDSESLNALLRQYAYSPAESYTQKEENLRHYQAEMNLAYKGRSVIGVERLYRRTVLLEPTTVCAAHCRWCLRGQYPVQTMKEEDITHATLYIGSSALRDDVNEVLITGGDPLMSLPLLGFTLSEIARNAPNVSVIRIGSRVPFQDPRRINDDLITMLARHSEFRYEIGVNTCHPVEFWPESVDALGRLRDTGVTLYNQNPLLKGVNDNLQILFDLYGLLREYGVEAHYFFHAIPMRGMSHHRTSLGKGLDLVSKLTSSGEFSGRAKPQYAVLSDIGKIVIYQDTVLDSHGRNNTLLLKSGFSYKDRMRWNPVWRMPKSSFVDADGYLNTWYSDGSDEGVDFNIEYP